jgi:two-component system nitrate/nitrite sensor histidine kinase NarX
MLGSMMRKLKARLAGRAILLLVVLAFLTVTLISAGGITASVVVAETVQGSGSAINVAGSLRRLAHRAASLSVATAQAAAVSDTELERAFGQFELALAHPALDRARTHESGGIFGAVYRGVEAGWHQQLKPRLRAAAHQPDQVAAALGETDAFVDQINTLVALLEQDAEGRISQLRDILAGALVLTLLVVAVSVYLLHRAVFKPLADLRESAARIAGGDFAVRSRSTGRHELGQVSEAFNAMAEQLARAYRDLEQRVEEKTADLTRSNRALELLYHVIARLYHAPASAETYAETLRDIERTFGLTGSFACVQAKHGGPARVLSSTLGACANRTLSEEECRNCPGREAPWTYRREGGQEVLQVPLRDTGHLYGMLRLALPAGERLRDWQAVLLEAVSRHMGIALGISHQSERDRLLALQEERSIIARELHDSLAQSLSYMKIQVSLLGPVLAEPGRHGEAVDILADLREGISAAYRQLRELLSTFRLRMEGDFARLLGNTVEEYTARSGVPVDLELHLNDTHLSPNQEIHVLHIIREALSNATRHAQATRICVKLFSRAGGAVAILIEDDGKGIDAPLAPEPHHYGLTIMEERARGLGGHFAITPRPGGGTRVSVHFNPAHAPDASAPATATTTDPT